MAAQTMRGEQAGAMEARAAGFGLAGDLGARRFVENLGWPRVNRHERFGQLHLRCGGDRHQPGHFCNRHAVAAKSANAALVGHVRHCADRLVQRLLLDFRIMAVDGLSLLPIPMLMRCDRRLGDATMYAQPAHQR
jgi:hypothetical protein